MSNIIGTIKTIFTLIFLFPYYFYLVYDIYRTSKQMNIPFVNFIADTNWFNKYMDDNIDLAYKISMGVWLSIYTIYYLTK